MPLVRSMKMRLRLSSRTTSAWAFGKLLDEVADLVDPVVVHVGHQAADAGVARMEALAGGRLEDVVDLLALVEGVEEGGEAAEVEGRGADAEQVIADARQLGEDGAEVLAARRQLDAQQLLDRVMPGDLVGDRRDVVHPIDDGDVLVVVEVFAELLEAGVQVADVGHGLDDGLAVEGEDEAQRGVRGRVLRAEVERPEVLLVGPLRRGEASPAQRHSIPA